MGNIADFIKSIPEAFNSPAITITLTVLTLFLLFYYTLSILKRNNARNLILIFTLFILVTGIIFILLGKDKGYGWIYFFIPLFFIIAVIIMFATEIKRDIWDTSAKKTNEIKHIEKGTGNNNANVCIDEIIKALQNMSKNDVGAIIILASSMLPKAILDSGVAIDADISSALIESIFFPKTPLHDGAMIINGTRIQSAGCFLPLSQELNIPKDLGTRHRAGIGITETINVTSLIVSEETGIISIAQGGKIKRYADSEMLRQTLKEFYWQDLIGQNK